MQTHLPQIEINQMAINGDIQLRQLFDRRLGLTFGSTKSAEIMRPDQAGHLLHRAVSIPGIMAPSRPAMQ